MSDQEYESNLKREVIEARNQAIKTDNQVKNLCLDVRSFERRFDALEQRTRLASVAVNLIVALVLAGCAYAVTHLSARSYELEIAQLKEAAAQARAAAVASRGQLDERLAAAQAAAARRSEAGTAALTMLQLLDSRQEQQAGDLLDGLNVAELSPLERALCEGRFADLRRRQAVASYRAGRQALVGRDSEAAVAQFRRSLRLDAKGTWAKASREYLAWTLWQAKRYQEAEPLLRAWLNAEPDEPTGTARYLLATTLLRQDKVDAARAEFLQVAGRADHSRFARPAQSYLDALAAGTELPVDLPDGRVRLSKQPQVAQSVQASPAAPAGEAHAAQVEPAAAE